MELNIATWISAAVTIGGGVVLSYFMFKDIDKDILPAVGFKVGAFSPWLAAV